jgi:FkbM family methyltransferase
MLFGNFEKEETAFFKRNIKEGDICFDIGGNIGFFSLLFARCAPNGVVHAFEPICLNAKLISVNAALNNMNNIIVNMSAVGSEQGFVTFSVSKDSAFSSMKDTGRKPVAESVTVPITTIDTYVAKNNITHVDIMKVDVEGAEEMVINGAALLLKNNKVKPRIILLELYDLNLAAFNTSVKRIMEKMISFGYSAYVIRHGNDELIPYEYEKHKTFYNIIFTTQLLN